MKASCNVIRDLLPLYAENIVSQDTSLMVEEHLDSCSECRKELEGMQKQIKLPQDTDLDPFRNLQEKLLTTKTLAIIFAVLITLLVAVIAIAYMTAPNYLPYSANRISITENAEGTVLATFNEEVTGYDIDRREAENLKGYCYHITTWSDFWSQHVTKRSAQQAILNPDMENVVSVYYYSDGAGEDVLIHGINAFYDGGVKTLPRLFSSYYLVLALALAFFSGMAMMAAALCKLEKIRKALGLIFLLPVSYLLGSLLIKGTDYTPSYSANRDFFAILLVMLPIYCMLLLAIISIRRIKQRRVKG